MSFAAHGGIIAAASRTTVKTFSPLLGLLNEHVSPERLYLETKWASLISFELAADLLKDTLPVAETVNAAGVRNHLHRVAERAEAALGDERVSFIEGCPGQWAALPHAPSPRSQSALTVAMCGNGKTRRHTSK